MDSLTRENICQVRDFISRHYGIHHPGDRLADLERKLTQIARFLGYQQQFELIRSLLAGQLGTTELQQLIEALTVGETYFFREPDAIDALLAAIIPHIRQQQGRRLRLWSAGCATGEEPYSLAMALDTHLSDAEHWDISILATDINQQSLQKATLGNYKAWSFRATPTYYKQRYFYPQPDGSFILDSRIRHMVQFNPLNLARQDYPSPANGTHQLDVIFCRNVLMYFAPQTINQIVQQFSRALTPGGWLVVSQTECSHYFQQEFETIQFGQTFLFRKRDPRTLRTPVANPGSPTTSFFENVKSSGYTHELSLSQRNTPEPQTTVSLPAPKSSTELLRQAQELANQGALTEACAHCEAGLAQQKLNAPGHYLHAMILQELNRPTEARDALRRALYLQPDMIMAICTLANLEQQQGHRREALRHFDNAFRILSMHKDDSLIPHSEGLSAGQLRELLMQLREG